MLWRRISQGEWIAEREAFDRAVAATPEVSRFCSSMVWTRAARTHLLGLGEEEADEDDEPEGEAESEPALRLPAAAIVGDTAIWRSEDASHWLLFGRSPWGYWQPFESAWMFSCPLLGPEPEETLEGLREIVRADPDLTPGFAIGGVPAGGRLHRALLETEARGGFRQYREFPATDCLGIDLVGGVESWLRQRSKKFRRSLSSASKRCRESGLEIEIFDGENAAEPGLFDRLLALQPRTAKWATGSDIFQVAAYRAFYRDVFDDLRANGRLRVLLATRDGEDAAYIFGGVFGGEYRGLQMSYAEEHASLGVGNWLQWINLERCAAEGVTHYDLGMESEYKLRWADTPLPRLITYVVV